MKNKNFFGHPLTKQEAKQVMGGHVFPLSEFEDKCPLCDKPIEINTYSYYIIFVYIFLREKRKYRQQEDI